MRGQCWRWNYVAHMTFRAYAGDPIQWQAVGNNAQRDQVLCASGQQLRIVLPSDAETLTYGLGVNADSIITLRALLSRPCGEIGNLRHPGTLGSRVPHAGR